MIPRGTMAKYASACIVMPHFLNTYPTRGTFGYPSGSV